MILNMFPMVVVTPDAQSHASCRVVADGRTCTVWRWTGTEFVVVIDGDAHDIAGTGPTWTLTTTDGPVTMTRQGGCGCGHPLKSHTPTPADAKGARRLYVPHHLPGPPAELATEAPTDA